MYFIYLFENDKFIYLVNIFHFVREFDYINVQILVYNKSISTK